MLTVEEALDRIVAEAGEQPVLAVDLPLALDLVLAEPVVADADSPPFDKSLMDGYAVRTADLPGGKGRLRRVGEILAGQTPAAPVREGEAVQIMTGAPTPPGADAVVMVERTRLDADLVEFDDPDLHVGQFIMPRGREYSRGETVLEPGARIGPAEMGLLAAVGCVRPKVHRRPTVAIVSTGDEIVPPDQTPGPGQIRNANESTLAALAERAGAVVRRLGVAGDDAQALMEKIGEGLKSDVLLLSGGVSAGKRDLAPGVLADLGVRTVFHGVAFKPGKPLYFGRKDHTLVFGLPGNPVSVLCCFEVFVQTALRARRRSPDPRPHLAPLPLAADFRYATRRPTYHPAKVSIGPVGLVVAPVSWYGSPDLRALTKANALVVFPSGEGNYRAGDALATLLLDRIH
jgi:molybdopterin molybdotransferase